MKKKVNELINDLWQKHPAIHRLDLDFDNKQLAVYSNNKDLIDDIGYFLCDFVSDLKNADFLIAIIDLNSDFSVSSETPQIVTSLFEDGRVDYDQNSKLSYIYSKERFMVVGPATQNLYKINDFIYSVVKEADYSF